MKQKTKLFVDLDGTLAEWRAAAGYEDLFRKEYFSSLKPHEHVVEALELLNQDEDIEIFILSAYLTESKYALREKNQWVSQHVPSIGPGRRLYVPQGITKPDYVAALVGDVDASYILQAILPYVEKTEHKLWMEQIRQWQKNDYKPVDSDTELKPHQMIAEICRQAGPEAVYVTDVGQHQMWAAQYLHHTKSRGFLTSGGLGTMGFGYGAAIGAQMALGRDARVIMLTGDGSFHMNLNEGCTAVSYGLPIITVIFNNQVLGMVRQWQTTFYGKRYSDTDPHRHTDFVKVAEGFGAKGYRATTPAEFKAAFADALKQQGPSWIDCRIGKDEKVLPMIPGGGDINDIIME